VRKHFPPQTKGVYYLTEGGQETEVMYRFGYDLPEFAKYPLLDRPDALTELRDMYERYLDTAADNGFSGMPASRPTIVSHHD
jgi:hypothetical protein